MATVCLYFKVLFQTGTFCTIHKDNKIVERRLGMTIEVWRINRLYNCIWHLIALLDKSPVGQLNDEPAPLILCGTSIDGTVFRTSFHITSIDVIRGLILHIQYYLFLSYLINFPLFYIIVSILLSMWNSAIYYCLLMFIMVQKLVDTWQITK